MRTAFFNGSKIEYNLVRKKVKNLNLRIKPDGSVNVSAPSYVSVKAVDAFVLANAAKILSAQKRFDEKKSADCKYLTDETVMLLGREYPLVVAEAAKNGYSFDNKRVILFVNGADDFSKRQTVFFTLCRDLAERVFPPLFTECYGKFADICKEKPQLRIRNMKSQWGNCRPQKNVITLSLRLAQFSEDVIRFVINHEFCHYYEQNHSKAFYARLSAVEPEWKKFDTVLKGK